MSEKSLAEQAAEKRREYKKQWNAKNRDKCREHVRRYWERKVLKEKQEVTPDDGNSNTD
jgi:hypothetical protein